MYSSTLEVEAASVRPQVHDATIPPPKPIEFDQRPGLIQDTMEPTSWNLSQIPMMAEAKVPLDRRGTVLDAGFSPLEGTPPQLKQEISAALTAPLPQLSPEEKLVESFAKSVLLTPSVDVKSAVQTVSKNQTLSSEPHRKLLIAANATRNEIQPILNFATPNAKSSAAMQKQLQRGRISFSRESKNSAASLRNWIALAIAFAACVAANANTLEQLLNAPRTTSILIATTIAILISTISKLLMPTFYTPGPLARWIAFGFAITSLTFNALFLGSQSVDNLFDVGSDAMVAQNASFALKGSLIAVMGIDLAAMICLAIAAKSLDNSKRLVASQQPAASLNDVIGTRHHQLVGCLNTYLGQADSAIEAFNVSVEALSEQYLVEINNRVFLLKAKTLLPLLAFLLLAMCPFHSTMAAEPKAKEVMVFANRNACDNSSVNTLVKGLPEGSQFHLVELKTLKPVASLSIPKYWNVASLSKNGRADALRSINKFMHVAEDLEAKVEQGFNYFGLLTTVSELRKLSSVTPDVIIVGDPIHMNGESPYNCVLGRFPADGCLNPTLQTPFSKRVAKSLGDARVQVVTSQYQWADNEYHQRELIRFFWLYCDANDAKLMSISPDLNMALSRVVSGEQTELSKEEVSDDAFDGMYATKVGDTFVHVSQGSQVEVRPQNTRGRIIGALPVNNQVRAYFQEVAVASNQTIVAINWWRPNAQTNGTENKPVDIDIWANRAGREADFEFLYFQAPNRPFGKLIRDIQAAGDSSENANFDRWELAIFESASLEDFDIFLDVFKGEAGPVHVRVVSMEKGIVKEQVIKFDAAGDEAKSHADRENHPSWKRVRF